MGLFGLIFYIAIIVFIIKVKQTAQSGASQKSGTNYGGKHLAQKHTEAKQMELFDMISEVSEKKTKVHDAIPNVPTKKKPDRTYMEPHKEEARQPKIRTNNLWGEDEHANQRIVALRLMEGDPVPGGYEKIRCPYCGADNLVTKHCKEYHSCYFCRVPID